MFNIDNVKEMIGNNIFNYNGYCDDDVIELTNELNYLFKSYNYTYTKNGSYELYTTDFKEELFFINSYKDIKKINIYLYEMRMIELTLNDGSEYIISDYNDYYFNYGVTLLKKG